jgi:hypothetical protein
MSKDDWRLVDVVAGENVVPREGQCVLKRAVFVDDKHTFRVNVGNKKMPVTCTHFEKIKTKDKIHLEHDEFIVEFEPEFRVKK